jgi:nucleoside-diphosphate-sugar epimerase
VKVLVTGGAGFLGKAIALKLRAAGHSVRSLSRGTYPELPNLGIETHSGDLTSFSAVLRAVTGCEAVIHTAAKAGIWGTYDEYFSVNVQGTRNVLEACLKAGVEKLVYTSSPSVVYSGGDVEGWNESAPYPSRFEAPYAETKAVAERLVLAANGLRLATVALRPHLILGPGDPHLIPRVIQKARAGRLRTVRAREGAKLVDCIHLENAAQAHLDALERLSPGSQISGRAYFLSQGEPIPTEDLINRILRAAGLPPSTRSISARAAYCAGAAFELVYSTLRIKHEPMMTRFLAKQLSTSHWFDISAARRELGYSPSVSLDEGFERLHDYFVGSPASS